MLALWTPAPAVDGIALDLSQVSKRVKLQGAYGAPGPVPPEWESPRKRADLIIKALGGSIEPDETDRQALAGAVRAQSRPASVARRFRGTLPPGR